MSSTTAGLHSVESVASRKKAAAESRKARKEARNPRSRLLSDSSDEVPKGILKSSRIPTKRSVSECIDDLSQILADLNLNIYDLPQASEKYCPCGQSLDEEDEDHSDDVNNSIESDDDDEEDNDGGRDEKNHHGSGGSGPLSKSTDNIRKTNHKNCDCNFTSGGDTSNDDISHEKPKKTVRFDERVYETVFFASRLYDRRYFAKYRLNSRYHPEHQNKSKKNRQRSSKSESSKDDMNCVNDHSKSKSEHSNKLTKSQRVKQSKRDRKRRLNHKEEQVDSSVDDHGYCSSFHSISD